ncbi:sigma-54-dependent transcriptional regulator [Sandaracinus amylolyticus]|uniref:Transcriptional regulator n=1 Tax=Sandaracinus amylolyticus TaxID=927083 RepID=A0A0F6W5K7_9BACT|nr:sigma 54-interacting transcriptional regulator [Sandaracinus amylolyticus]AKF07980.1 Transcriptional regulator [Sandaracinus amylolyticus]
MSATRPKLLVIDDGDRYVELAHALLRDYDYATRCDQPGPCWDCARRTGCTLTHAHDAREAEEALARHRDVDVVLLDVAFDVPEERLLPSDEPDLERRRRLQGIDILAHLRRARGELPVVLMTSEEEIAFEDAAEALSVDEFATLAGEAAYDARALSLLVERVLARRRDSPEAGGYTWGGAATMARLRRDALALARTSLPMLILGETGTGKSALAERVIHPATRRTGPFVAVDLAAIPETLIASELFGTTRGAFSGAVDRRGRFEEASGGTLFLDEIGNLPPEAQRMLLLALQDGRITRLGETAPRAVDVKLIAATNADLRAKVTSGAFRADLYARLNPAARLVVPPLRERLEDLEELAHVFVRRKLAAGADRALLAEYMEVAGIRGAPHAELQIARRAAPRPPSRGVGFVLARSSLDELMRHAWPGNVRELELLVASAVVFALSDALEAAREGRGASGEPARTIPIPAKLIRELLGALAPDETPSGKGPRVAAAFDVRPGATLHEVARSLEAQLYERLFVETKGDFDAMAKRLLAGRDPSGARRVRLRFNQLGLRARKPVGRGRKS